MTFPFKFAHEWQQYYWAIIFYFLKVPWVMPPAGMLKLNIDGAFLAQSGQDGAGMILRQSDGTIVFVVMSTHASILVDSVGPPSAEVYRTAASFP
jgi:hypothetical protein